MIGLRRDLAIALAVLAITFVLPAVMVSLAVGRVVWPSFPW